MRIWASVAKSVSAHVRTEKTFEVLETIDRLWSLNMQSVHFLTLHAIVSSDFLFAFYSLNFSIFKTAPSRPPALIIHLLNNPLGPVERIELIKQWNRQK